MGDAAVAAAMASPPPLPPLDVRSIGHPSVRDLAWVLSMPQVLTGSPRYFPLWPGLGADATALHACRELLERLDADPRPLEAFLAGRRKTRLGDRFEALCHYALAHVALPRAGGGDAEPPEAQSVAALRWGVQVHDARPAAEAYLGGGVGGRAPMLPPGGGGRRGRLDDAALGGASEVGRGGRDREAAAAGPPAAAVVSDDAEQLRRLASLSMGDGGAGAAYVQWQGRRMEAELRRRERNRSAAKRAQARRAAEVTIGELDFVFLDAASSRSSGGRSPDPPPCVRHVEVSVKYLLWSPALTDAKRAGGVAPDMPRGTGIVCGCSRCCPTDAASSSAAAGSSAPAAPAPQDECAVAWSAGLDGFHGPHRIESLTLKIRRGSAQLALALAPRAQEWLRAYVTEAAGGASTTALSSAPALPLSHPPVAVTSSYVLKGYLFYPLAEWAWRGDGDGGGVGRRPRQCVWSDECLSPALLAALPASVPARHPAGWYTDSVDALLARRPASRWVVLPKPFWLGPLVMPCEPDEAEAMERGWAAAAAGAAPAATAAPHPASPPAGPHSALDPAPVLLPAHMSVDAFDQMTSAEEKARVVARLRAHAMHMRRELPGSPVPGGSAGPSGGFIKYAGPGSELTLWGGLGRNALPRVSDGARLAADVAANHAVAVRCASARALRLLVAEVVYDPGWVNGGAGARPPPSHPDAGDSGTGCPPQTRGRAPPGAWVEVSRGFVVEDGWATEGDAAHAARFGEEMPVGHGAKRAGTGAGSGAGARRGPGVDAYV